MVKCDINILRNDLVNVDIKYNLYNFVIFKINFIYLLLNNLNSLINILTYITYKNKKIKYITKEYRYQVCTLIKINDKT